MLQYLRLVGLALLLSVGFGSMGQAASFDCNKAITVSDKLVCEATGGGVAAVGTAAKAAGLYTLTHAVTGATMLGSTEGGADANLLRIHIV